MKLKQHREDVKDLRLMADPHVQDIARRYLNLIRMAEKYFSYLERYMDVMNPLLEEQRVLKDSEGRGE